MTLYVNGVSQGTPAATGTAQESKANFTIGKRPDQAGDHFPGLIDDVAIFNEILDSTQLNNVMTQGAENFNIPEPSTAILAGLGLMGICFRRRRA